MLQELRCFPFLCFWIWFAFAWQQMSSHREAKAEHVTVCQILTNPSAYRQKHVVVTGWIRWDRDSFALADDTCHTTLRTGNHQWKRAICLRSADDDSISEEQSLALFGATVSLHQAPLWRKEVRIQASLIGILESRNRYVAQEVEGGQFSLNGYCHMDEFPARLNYRGVERFVIYYTPFVQDIDTHVKPQRPLQPDR